MMVSTKSLCLLFLVFLVCFLTLPRLADEEPINSRSAGSRDPSYNEDSHVVLTNPLQAAGVVSPFLAAASSKSQAAVADETQEEQKVDHQHPLPVLTQHPIVMQPSLADFKEVPVGMPQIKTVTINNPSPSQTLQLTSVSGDTPDFHPSFFQSKVVRPGDSTMFDIVFLPRRVGRVGTVLYIHTSLETFKYEVYGTSIPNPYRLRAFLGIKMPLNATYSPVISMYNPHSTALQVTEIYSSGGDLHLELLTGQTEGSKSLWEIRPYETKPIIKLNFFGRSINNHTSFIRIRTNYTLEESPIALPVEVKVTQATGIFLSREFIDFGLLKSGDEGKSVPLFLLNAGPGNVHVSSITTVPPNDAIQVIYIPTTLRQSSKYIKIATVLYHVDKVQDLSQHQGKIVVVFEDPSSDILEIPYEATVLQGAMTYEKTQTLFKVGKPPFKAITRNMSLANQFSFPITVYDVRLPAKAQEHFMVNFTKGPYVLYPSMGWQKPFSVTFSPTSSDCQFSTSLRLHTNSSYFTIPLHCYDGKLKYEVKDIDKDSLEYGLMRYTDTISKQFVVININPVKISVTDYKVKGVDYASVELMYVQPSPELQGMMESTVGNSATVYRPHRTPFTIDVGHEAVFEVNITKPDIKGRHEGEILIKTSLGKELHIPVFYKVVLGTLQVEPEVVLLNHAHPFTMVNASFSVWSFFNQPVKVLSVQPSPPNPQFYYVPPEGGNPLLLSEKMTQMGTIAFDPSKGERLSQKPYLGLDQDDGRSSISSWINSLNGISNQRVAENDARDYKLIRGLWNKIKMKRMQATLILETDMNSNYEINAEARLHWPSLLSNTTISFPTTLLGNTSVQHVAVNNPTNQPLLVQALMLAVYPNPDTVLRLLKGQYSFNSSIFDSSDLTTFYLPDSEAFENVVPADTPQQEEGHHEVTRLAVAHSPLTVTSLIPPQSSAVVRVAFSPKVEKNFTSLLLLRNNLTILDALMVHGYGAAVQLLFGGKEPGAPLLFEYTEASLIQCHKELAAANSLRLVKTFTMRNTGQLPLHVLSMDFGGYGCTDYGFVVENCTADFVLEPNATKDVQVSFTPDFTMSRIQRTLILHMTHSTELAFTFLATLPHSLLPLCYAALPRLDIEKLLSKIAAVFMILLLIFVVMMAIYSAQFNNICQYYELDLLRHGTSVFDLNNLTEDGYISRSDTAAGTQVETIRPGKAYIEASAVPKNSQESTTNTSFQEPSGSTSTAARIKVPLDDPEANTSHKALQSIVDQSSSNHSSANNINSGLSQRSRDSSQSMDEADGNGGKSNAEFSGNNDAQLVSSRSSKPIAAVTGTSRSSPSKSTSKADSFTSPSVVAVTDSSSQTPPLSNSQTTSESPTVDVPTYSKRSKLSKKQSSKSLKQQNAEVTTSAKKSEVKDKTKLEKESVEKEANHEHVVVKEKGRDKVKPFTKDAGTGQAIPIEDAPQDGGVDAEDDVEDGGKKEVSTKGKDKKKKARAQPKREEKESKRKRDRELEMAEFIKNKRLSSESIEVESTTSTENLDDENPNGEPDEKPVKATTGPSENKEVVRSESNRPNDSPTGQSAPPEEEITKEPVTEQPNQRQPKTNNNDKKTLQLTEIMADPFSRKPDKTSYTSKKIVGVLKKQSAERTKSASSEEPDDSKPTTPVGGAKPRAKNKQVDGDVSGKAEEQEAKSPDAKVEGVRLTSPHDIAASLLSKNTIIARSKMKVEKEAKEANKYDMHPNAKISPLGKPNDMMTEENYILMQGNLPHHPHRYPADFNRADHGVLSLHAEPFVPTVGTKEHPYYPEEPRPMNRMEVSRSQTGKTLGDFMPPSVTQPSRHYHPKKHPEYSDHHKGMFEDPRMLRPSHHMMHHPQQKVSPTMVDDSHPHPHHMYHHSVGYHSDRMSHDPQFGHRRTSLDHGDAFFEEDYSGLQSFDQQLGARNSRPSNLPYNADDSSPFYSANSHNIISASSGRKGMNVSGSGLTLTSPTSMFESPKKQHFPSFSGYPRPVGGNSTTLSDDSISPGYSRQHYLHTLKNRRVGKQPQRLPPPGLGDSPFGEVMHDRGGGMPWGTEEFGSESGNLQLQQQQQLLRRQQLLLQQQQHQSFDPDDYNEAPNLHSATSPVFPNSSLSLAPGSGVSSALHEPRPPPMDLGWDVSSNRSDKYMSDVPWGSNSSSAVGNNSSVSMLWRQGSSHGSRSQSLSSMSDTNSTELPKFTGNMYGLFDGPGSIWDPAASSGNSSLLPWATALSPSENKDNSTN